MSGSLLDLVIHLVGIDSVNPALSPGGSGEARIATFVRDRLQLAGVSAEIVDHGGGRASVFGSIPGRNRGKGLVLYAHLDTVGVQGMEDPFHARLVGSRIRGRGSCDMKGALAVCLEVMSTLASEDPPPHDVMFMAVADEEDRSLGTRELVPMLDGRATRAIVTEVTNLRACVAHRGFAWFEVQTNGRAAHGSRYDLGIDANLKMSRILVQLAEEEARLAALEEDRLLGRPSLHVGVLQGGQEPSTYASDCRAVIERRMLPHESIGEVEAHLRSVVGVRPLEGAATLKQILFRPAFQAQPSSSLLKALDQAAVKVLGAAPARIGKGGWMDASLLAAAGLDTVVFGPQGGGAHTPDEWVDLPSLRSLRDVLLGIARAKP